MSHTATEPPTKWVVQIKTPKRGRKGGGYVWEAVSVHRTEEAANRAAAKVRLPAAPHSAVRVVPYDKA